MLTFWGGKHRFCDRVSRRNFLQVGAPISELTLQVRLSSLTRAQPWLM